MTTKVAPQRLKPGSEMSELRATLEEFTASSGYKFYTYLTERIVAGRRIINFDPRERPLHMTNIPSD